MNAGEHALVPVVDDPDTAGFFAAAAEQRLVIRVCGRCGAQRHLPTAYCNECGAVTEHWVQVAGRGVVHTWTTVEHQTHPAFEVPYTVILVDVNPTEVNPTEVDPGDRVGGSGHSTSGAPVRLLGWLAGRPELRIGQPVSVEFITIGGVTVPNWVLDENDPAFPTTTEDQ